MTLYLNINKNAHSFFGERVLNVLIKIIHFFTVQNNNCEKSLLFSKKKSNVFINI